MYKKKYCYIPVHKYVYKRIWSLYTIDIPNLSFLALAVWKENGKQRTQKEHMKPRFSRAEYLSILGRFCVKAGTPVEIEKCTSSKTERDTRIAELMTTAPPTKPNTNSSMHPGFMALCWHGETPEPRRLHRGRGCIFVGKVCHSATATKTMPSAAAFHSSAAAPEQWHHRSPPPRSIDAATQRHSQPWSYSPLLSRRVHRLESFKICIIYSHQALRTNGSHDAHLRQPVHKATAGYPLFWGSCWHFPCLPECKHSKKPKSFKADVQSISQRLTVQQQKPLSTDFYTILLPHSNHTTNLSDSAKPLL